MADGEILAGWLLVASVGLLVYAYGIYPGCLWVLSRLIPSAGGGPGGPRPAWPDVSIVLSAYNEEHVIGDRVRNFLELDYPVEHLEILVGSDGSTDRTCEVIAGCAAPGVRLIAFEPRRGKASVLNDLVAQARGEIIVCTDANTFFLPDAVRKLVDALWRYPSACAVVGRLELRSSVAAGNLDGPYWRYETWMKTLESHFGCVLGANGAIYAFRRKRYQPLPTRAIVDDFLIPMLMRVRSGGGVFFVPEARAWETSPQQVRDEFRRRARIGAGDLQALLWTWQLLLPWKGMVALTYFSHKVLRWFGPWLLLIAFGANLWLLGTPFFRWLFIGQLAFYGLGLGAGFVRVLALVASAVRYFLALNTGLLLGFARGALGLARPLWNTTPRTGEVPSPGLLLAVARAGRPGGPAASREPRDRRDVRVGDARVEAEDPAHRRTA
ncbi:MAG: glycosyltransferase family 2 protein [Candidatus Rokubacteria bacterium]|nr:glycosyltransferase family 2 protein [Candidatus Rokubacteria bacterium]